MARWLKSPHLLLSLAMLCWAGNWVVGRAVHDLIPPLTLNFWRWAGCAAISVPVAWVWLRREWPVLLRNWRWVLPMCFMGTTLFQSMIYLGLQSTTALNGALINATIPVFVALLAWPVLGDRIGARQGLGILISLAGVAAIITRADPAVVRALRFNPGDLWILAAMPVWSLYTVLLKRWPAGLNRMTFLAAMGLVGTVMMAPLYAGELAAGQFMAVTPQSIAAIAFVAFVASFLANVFYNTGMAHTSPASAGLFHHLHPAFTAVLGMIFLGERMGWYHLLGVAFIAAGLYLTTSGTRPAAAAARAAPISGGA
jgi:drug/metabolite transporter (DMT)-like permease